ncbi:hypothetical protein [Streptosporangium sp. V21-05]|uniref:hypothetical protein n=1 Tax=Streptosporangium sp. V21-05 TaxID=3446115 RepID=UPI003F533615
MVQRVVDAVRRYRRCSRRRASATCRASSTACLGELLAGRRDRFTLATKFANGVGPAAGVMGMATAARAWSRRSRGA